MSANSSYPGTVKSLKSKQSKQTASYRPHLSKTFTCKAYTHVSCKRIPFAAYRIANDSTCPTPTLNRSMQMCFIAQTISARWTCPIRVSDTWTAMHSPACTISRQSIWDVIIYHAWIEAHFNICLLTSQVMHKMPWKSILKTIQCTATAIWIGYWMAIIHLWDPFTCRKYVLAHLATIAWA